MRGERRDALGTLAAVKRIVILISGRGSNMEAIARACAAERWPARVAAVISNVPAATGLAAARALGLPVEVIDHRGHATREAFDAELAQAIDRHGADVVALAGFMRILGEGFVRRYAGRLLNVHPSLLPSFTGLRTHEQALRAGVKLHGATVHFVTPQLDHGPIIAQAAVPVLPEDTAETLAARVQEKEHLLYPRALRWFVEDRLVLSDGIVRVRGGDAQWIV
jgi:phosphoribosylglycinamide formyltransferase-1